MWKETKEIGIGTALSKSGEMKVVFKYKPAGNIIGSYKDNVGKKSASEIGNEGQNRLRERNSKGKGSGSGSGMLQDRSGSAFIFLEITTLMSESQR